MLNTHLLHPDILRILAQSGHHSKVLVADGNYPAANKRGPRAELVSLQLMPGVPTVAQVLEAVLGTVQIDEVHTMGVDRSDSYAAATPGDPPVWEEYRRILAAAPDLQTWQAGRTHRISAGFYTSQVLEMTRR